MKYIDSEKLIVEIERELSAHDKVDHLEAHEVGKAWNRGHRKALENILDFITSLQQEQPEVVLTDNASFTKELKRFLSDTGNEKKRRGVVLPIIKHFYELGLNARKEG